MRDLACPRCFGRGQVSDPTRTPLDPAYQVLCPACYPPRKAKPKGPPILCFEEDIDAGLAAAKELATKGYALLADGFWHVTPGHMARLKAQVKHLQSQMVRQLAGNWDHVGAIDVAFAELYKLLPGGDK